MNQGYAKHGHMRNNCNKKRGKKKELDGQTLKNEKLRLADPLAYNIENWQ